MPQKIELPYINNENATKKVIASNLGPMITPKKTQGGATNIISSNICGIMINLFIGGLIAIEPQLKVLFFTALGLESPFPIVDNVVISECKVIKMKMLSIMETMPNKTTVWLKYVLGENNIAKQTQTTEVKIIMAVIAESVARAVVLKIFQIIE